MARKNEPTPVDWFDDAEEVPRGDIDFIDTRQKKAKKMRVFVWSTLILLPLSLAGNFVLAEKSLNAPDPVPQAQNNQLDSPTKSAAMLAVENWLKQNPSPLPGGHVLSWDGVKIQKEPSVTVDKNTGSTTEVQGLQLHTLTVVSATGSVFTTQVQVAYSPIRGAQVLGTPTLIPKAPDDKSTWPNLNPWPDFTPTQKTDGITQSVNAWVKAFTSGDPDALRLAVGDTAADHSYVPISQVTASKITLGQVAAKPNPDAKANTVPDQVIANVTFSVTWPGETLDNNAQPALVSYDVLITKANTAAPTVVAWGGAGTGESLTAYSNAVTGRTISSDSLSTAVPSATSQAGK